MNATKYKDSNLTINNIETTENTISGRGGLTLISRYIESVKFYRLAEKKLGNFRLNLKGKAISSSAEKNFSLFSQRSVLVPNVFENSIK